MKFDQKLIEGTLIKRYKRFLADVELDSGEIITAHTPNTGSMRGCCTPGSRVWLSRAANPGRKYPLSWELVEAKPGVLVGINTALPNRLAGEAIENGVIGELQDYTSLRFEVPYGKENSRIDILLEDEQQNRCFVELKNVTLVENELALFPDAVSKRGTKHLRELIAMHRAGCRSVIFFCIQREDALQMAPADEIDAEYGRTLREAVNVGVEAIAYRARVNPEEITLDTGLPVIL